MAHASHSDGHHGHHIIPFKVLARVIIALVFLTVFTVWTSQFDLGAFTVPLALAIALTKAGLVLAFFMGLKYDNKVNTLVFSLGAFFVIVFLVFTLFDTAFRGDVGNMSVDPINMIERQEEALQTRSNEVNALQSSVDEAAAQSQAETATEQPEEAEEGGQ